MALCKPGTSDAPVAWPLWASLLQPLYSEGLRPLNVPHTMLVACELADAMLVSVSSDNMVMLRL
jgi:hypothetical protein